MSWHLNLDKGTHYSRRLARQREPYQNGFGVTKKGRQIELGSFVLDLADMERQGFISTETNSYYRIHFWFDGSRFYVARTRDAREKKYYDFPSP
jgi:hypothetical protein